MELWKVLGIALLTLIVLALILSVLNDANATPLGPCEEESGSVCTPDNSCPTGYNPSIRHDCAITEDYLCCLPA